MPQTSQKRIAVRAIPWGLTAVMLAVSAWLWVDLVDRAEPFLEPTQSPTAMHALAPLTLPAQAAFEDYRFALERPLFHPSRTPFPDRKSLAALEAAAKARQAAPSPAALPQAPPAPPPQGFLLRGTVIADPLLSAVFERVGKESYVRVRQGEQLEGWTLVEITRENVVLRLGDRTVTWPLAKDEGRPRRP